MAGLDITSRAFWLIVHLGVGAVFLHGFIEVVLALRGSARELRPMALFGSASTAFIAWATVISGTWIVYPWYRAKPPADVASASASLISYPQRYLMANSNLIEWHSFGMEWKEHVGWIAPILATAVAFVILRYRRQILAEASMRRALMVLIAVSFFAGVVAATLGVFINKMAPNQFLAM